jgi:nitrogen fixation protein NifU and related proteins
LYSDKVIDHFQNPRNMGEIENASGCGEVGNPTCGDIMKLWIQVDENGIITDAKFKTFGCASAIASSSIATEMIKGKHLDEARAISNQAIVEALDGLPKQKIHCSVLAAEAINKAIDDYLGIKREGDLAIVCICKNLTRGEIEEAIGHGAFTLSAVKQATGAMTGACKGLRCTPFIQEMLEKYNVKGSEDGE